MGGIEALLPLRSQIRRLVPGGDIPLVYIRAISSSALKVWFGGKIMSRSLYARLHRTARQGNRRAARSVCLMIKDTLIGPSGCRGRWFLGAVLVLAAGAVLVLGQLV